MINIMLVDDQELVRTGFRMVLDAQDDMTVVGEAGDGLTATRLLQSRPTDVQRKTVLPFIMKVGYGLRFVSLSCHTARSSASRFRAAQVCRRVAKYSLG